MQLIVLIVTSFEYTPHLDTENNVIWVRPTQPVVPAVKR